MPVRTTKKKIDGSIYNYENGIICCDKNLNIGESTRYVYGLEQTHTESLYSGIYFSRVVIGVLSTAKINKSVQFYIHIKWHMRSLKHTKKNIILFYLRCFTCFLLVIVYTQVVQWWDAYILLLCFKFLNTSLYIVKFTWLSKFLFTLIL